MRQDVTPEAAASEQPSHSYSEKGTIMRIVVDFDLCESNAVCMGIAPEIFEVRDDDFLYVLDENPPESMRAKMEESVQRCPKQAISIAED
jgi:ferredoxin